MNTNYRILVVDDEEDLCDILKFNLENEGYEVETANSAEEALKMDLTKFHLLLLDVMMGEISGFKMAKMLKQVRETRDIPIIFLTARDTENDAVTGFTLGADDYISKPFSLRELAARVKALIRRKEYLSAQPRLLRAGSLTMNLDSRQADLNGRPVELTAKEFDLLSFLMRHSGQVLTREQLLDTVWGVGYAGEARTVDVHIRYLRQKLEEEPDNPKRILTVRGVGYRFADGT